eukprot:366546-Chlamydomonas_euryale.AAC.44
MAGQTSWGTFSAWQAVYSKGLHDPIVRCDKVAKGQKVVRACAHERPQQPQHLCHGGRCCTVDSHPEP